MKNLKPFLPMVLVLLFSALAGCCVHSQVRHPEARPTLVDELKSDTVALVHRDDDEDIVPFCTGVWVDKDKILTADHCARAPVEAVVSEMMGDSDDEDAAEKMVQDLEDGFKINYIVDKEVTGVWKEPKALHVAKVLKHDKAHDLALMVVEDVKDMPEHHVARLADAQPSVGENLHIVGHVVGMYYTYFPATVAAYREEDFRPFRKSGVVGPWMQVSGPVYKGNSGGAGFNDNGELCGIASRLIPAPNASMYVHLESIRSFLGKPRPR